MEMPAEVLAVLRAAKRAVANSPTEVPGGRQLPVVSALQSLGRLLDLLPEDIQEML